MATWRQLGPIQVPVMMVDEVEVVTLETAQQALAAVAVPETREATEMELSAGESFDEWWNSLTPQAVAWPPRALAAAAHGSGAAAERQRIRRELLEDLMHQHQGKMPLWVFDDIAASIKRICPEEG